MKDHENSQKLSRALFVVLGVFILIGMVTPVSAAPKLSPGMDVLASDFSMAVNGLAGTEIYLSKEDFASSLGVDSVGRITVVSLPDSRTGRLQLGSRYVEVGQTISERSLDDLKFVPFGTDEAAAVFGFCRGSDVHGTVYTCTVYTTKKVNTAPYFEKDSVSTAAGEPSVYSGVTHLGTLNAVDSEGDALTYELVSAPSNGTVRLTDKSRGYFEYTSDSGYIGKDSFTVCATDKYGNRSAPAKMTLRVGEVNSGEVFADTKEHYSSAAVIACVRSGIIEAAAADSRFYPDEYISRAEFLSLAMRSAGFDGFSTENTGFTDDADIPKEYKGCVAAAEAFGFINGIDDGSGRRFCPNNQITRLEAAVILSRITGITGDGTVAVFADSDAVPVWAQDAVNGLHSAGILRGNGSGSIDAYAPITRGAAVQLVYSAMSCLN